MIADCTACGNRQTEIGISIKVTGTPEKPLKDEFGLSKIDICYSCWFKSLGVKTLEQKRQDKLNEDIIKRFKQNKLIDGMN